MPLLCHKNWKSLFGAFLFVVCIHDHIFFVARPFLADSKERKNTAIKTHSVYCRRGQAIRVHKSSRAVEKKEPEELKEPLLRHYYNQFLFILQFTDNFSSSSAFGLLMGWFFVVACYFFWQTSLSLRMDEQADKDTTGERRDHL